jgi:hypothetical protein
VARAPRNRRVVGRPYRTSASAASTTAPAIQVRRRPHRFVAPRVPQRRLLAPLQGQYPTP